MKKCFDDCLTQQDCQPNLFDIGPGTMAVISSPQIMLSMTHDSTTQKVQGRFFFEYEWYLLHYNMLYIYAKLVKMVVEIMLKAAVKLRQG